MTEGKYYRWLLPLFACLLAACGDDEYHYPSVKLEFLTAHAGADGSLQSVLTDEGKTYRVVEDATNSVIDANSSVRIVGNYGPATASDGISAVKLYAAMRTVSPVPQPAGEFEGGVKTDPADVLSIWMGLDYLNITLNIKAQGGRHTFHFIEDKVASDVEAGHKEVYLTLYHDAAHDTGYTQRAYLSVPLRQYAAEGVEKVTVHFSLHTYSGEMKTYDFDYVPLY
ncbi:NigD1/NigD2 family lipoprotein [Bacteroides fluxus]|jgi:hypothetical protein